MKQKELEGEINTVVREAHNAIAQAHLVVAEYCARPASEVRELRLDAARRMFEWCARRCVNLAGRIEFERNPGRGEEVDQGVGRSQPSL